MIQIDKNFIRAYSSNEQLVMLRLLLNADDNGNVEFCERGLSKDTGISYKTIRNIHKRLIDDGILKGAPKGAPEGAVGGVVTICDYDSYTILTKIRAHIGGALKGALKEQEIIKDKDNVFPHTPLLTEIENNKEQENITPYNPPSGDEREVLAKLAEMEKAFAALSEENKMLKGENELLKKRREKKEKQENFDVRADLSYVTDYSEIWSEWLDYKDKINKQYKTQNGASKEYKGFVKTANGSKAKAQSIVDQSIKNSWQGLFDIKDWVEPIEGKDPWKPNLDKYEPADLEFSERFNAYRIPNKFPICNHDWPYTPENRPDGARVCNGSDVWVWNAELKIWREDR